jgi:hypothetical protein
MAGEKLTRISEYPTVYDPENTKYFGLKKNEDNSFSNVLIPASVVGLMYEVMTEDEFNALPVKSEGVLYLIIEE